ncbi:hypothetical protein BDR22DRAFT_856849 [Usnea florida]
MSLIQLHGSSSSGNTFSIQGAAEAFSQRIHSSDQSGILFTHGCNDIEPLKCTTACQDPAQIFKSPYTLQNCMVLSALAPSNWVQPNETTLPPSKWKQPLSTEALGIATEFGINTTSRDFPSLASNVTRTIQDCLGQYCDSKNNCRTFTEVLDLGDLGTPAVLFSPWYYPPDQTNITNSDPFYSMTCPSGAALNADIGGIGVYISYWMQTAIALSGFLLLKLCDDQFYRWSIAMYYLFWPLGFRWPVGLIYVKRKASSMQANLCRYSPVIKSSLVEFHKAQCFFILAIEIAANIAVRQGTLNDSVTTLQGLFNNYSLVGSVSISGFLPVTFTLLALHRAGTHSYYLLILSHCALVLSAITMFSVGDFAISRVDEGKLTNASFPQYPNCGSRDPTTFCLNVDNDDYGDVASSTEYLTSMNFGYGTVGGPALLFTCIVMALIDLDYFGLQRTSNYKVFVKWLGTVLERLTRSINDSKRACSTQHLLAVFKDCLYFCIWVWYIIFITISLEGLYYPSNGATLIPVRSWTVGQIVAITVWAGPLFEFVKLSVQGLKKGLDYRTPHPFTITEPDGAAKEEEYRVWFKWSRPVVKEEPVFKIF